MPSLLHELLVAGAQIAALALGLSLCLKVFRWMKKRSTTHTFSVDPQEHSSNI